MIKTEIKPENDVGTENDIDIDTLNWNNIAITSLTTIFEYVNAKFLYLNVTSV